MQIKTVWYKLLLGVAFLLFIIALAMFFLNPFRISSTDISDGIIDYISAEGAMGYTFTVGDNKVSGEADGEFLNGLDVGDIISVRYLVNSPQKNTVNMYEYIYSKEINTVSIALILLSFDISLLVIGGEFKKNKALVLKELEQRYANVSVNKIRNALYGSIALIGIPILLLGGYYLTVGPEGIAIGILLIMVGALFIGNYLFFRYRAK